MHMMWTLQKKHQTIVGNNSEGMNYFRSNEEVSSLSFIRQQWLTVVGCMATHANHLPDISGIFTLIPITRTGPIQKSFSWLVFSGDADLELFNHLVDLELYGCGNHRRHPDQYYLNVSALAGTL